MAATRLNPGDLFASKFRIMDVIGSGSMGVVYRVESADTGEVSALKLMHPALAMDPKSVHRFEREARAGMQVSSPHIAKVLATGCEDDELWIQMEVGEGVRLDQFMKAYAPLTKAQATDLLCQIFSALRAAHTAGVVHRDLKPENIVVSGGQQGPLHATVLDFGIAKSLTSHTALETAPGQGTPLWTAPEQTRADNVPHPSADVWALGLLTFYVFSGAVYWKHAGPKSSMVELSMELVRSPIVKPTERAKELGLEAEFPLEFDEWFLRCVNRDPADRYPSAGAALRGLMMILDRREHPRLRLWLPVYCDTLSGGVAITHDASDNGMLVLARTHLEKGERLDVRFSVPPGSNNHFQTSARVVRSGPNADDPEGLWKYQLAVAFDEEMDGLQGLLQSLATDLEDNP